MEVKLDHFAKGQDESNPSFKPPAEATAVVAFLVIQNYSVPQNNHRLDTPPIMINPQP